MKSMITLSMERISSLNFIYGRLMKGIFLLLFICLGVNSKGFGQYCNTATTNIGITPTLVSQNSPTYNSGRRAFNFTANAGCTYEFSTCGLSGVDTYLRLYSTATGGTLLAQSDDFCGSQSTITWLCPTTGNYSVLLTRYTFATSGCATLNANAQMSYRIVSCVPPDPTSITSTSTSICSGQSVTLTANGASGTVYWFTGSCATVGQIATGNSITVSPVTTTTYYARNYDGVSFSTNCVSQTIIVKPVPTVNAGADATICAPSSTTLSGSSSTSNLVITEEFDAGPPAGWVINNLSNPLGINNWFLGNSAVFTQQSGTGYLGANFNSVTGVGTISDWIITPMYTLNNGDVITFYTRGPVSTFPDRLEVRMSTNGASVNVGANETTVGDFTTLLLGINPTLAVNGYPQVWTQYSITISGLGGPTNGRIAFRYFVTNGGPSGTNSDYIGIDNFTYTSIPTITNTWSPATALSATNILNPTANPSSTITYTLTATANGCSNTDNVTINVNNGASASITSANTNICIGQQSTIGGNVTASGPWTLTLSNGQTTTGTGNAPWGIVVNPTGTTTYTVSSINDGVACPTTLTGSTILTLPSPGVALGLDGDNASCVVNQSGWVHFYENASGRLLASINSAGQNLGNVSVTSYVDVTNQIMPACTNPNPIYETAVMQRHWVITPQFQPVTPVQVRLPFGDGELTTLSGVANVNANPWDNVATIADIQLSKYSGPLNVDNNALNNCPANGGSGGTTIHAQVANGLTTGYSSVGSAQYTDFSIPGFSEFWLHASSMNSPLPIELTSLLAICNGLGDEVEVNWTTASEHNTSHFDVERSIDGSTWEQIGTVQAAGNSTISKSYNVKDNDARGHSVIYYRLNQVDQDGAVKVYGPTSAECFSDQNSFALFPNPAREEVTILLNDEYSDETLLIFNDINGKVVKTVNCHEQSSKLITVDIRDLLPGVYLVRMMDGENNQFSRLIKQ